MTGLIPRLMHDSLEIDIDELDAALFKRWRRCSLDENQADAHHSAEQQLPPGNNEALLANKCTSPKDLASRPTSAMAPATSSS